MSLSTDDLSDADLTRLAQAARQMAQDIYNGAIQAETKAIKDLLNDHADTWAALAAKVDEIIEGEV